MIGSDRKLCFSEQEQNRVQKDYIKRIMNEENDWDLNVEEDAVGGPVGCVSREEVGQTLKVKAGKASGLLDVSMEFIAASEKLCIHFLLLLCHGVLD